MTIINRYLSIMTWCDDQFSIAQDGWSGNPVPVAVPRRNLAFTTAQHWVFDRKIPSSEKKNEPLPSIVKHAMHNRILWLAMRFFNFFKIFK